MSANHDLPSFLTDPLAHNNTRFLALLIIHLYNTNTSTNINTRSLTCLARKLNHVLYMTGVSSVCIVNALRFYKLAITAINENISGQRANNNIGMSTTSTHPRVNSLKNIAPLAHFIACLSISNKTYDDSSFTNSTWSQLSKISLQKINSLELSYLQILNYNVFSCCFNTVDYSNWINYLEKMHLFLNVTYLDLLNVKIAIKKKSHNSKKLITSSKRKSPISTNNQKSLLTPPYFNTNNSYSKNHQLPPLLPTVSDESINTSTQNFHNILTISPESTTCTNFNSTINDNLYVSPDLYRLIGHEDCSNNFAIIQDNYNYKNNPNSDSINAESFHNYTSSVRSIDPSKMLYCEHQQQAQQVICMPSRLQIMLPPPQNLTNRVMHNLPYFQNSMAVPTIPVTSAANAASSFSSYNDKSSGNLNTFDNFNNFNINFNTSMGYITGNSDLAISGLMNTAAHF